MVDGEDEARRFVKPVADRDEAAELDRAAEIGFMPACALEPRHLGQLDEPAAEVMFGGKAGPATGQSASAPGRRA